MNNKEPVFLIDTSSLKEFKDRSAEAVAKGYKLHSSYCGFVQSENYDFCSSWQAIFVLPSATIGNAKT